MAALVLLGASMASAQTPPAESSDPGAAEQITVDGRRPRFGRLFVSPMGEPFREGEAPEKDWFAGVDTNHDGKITRTEFIADAMRFFGTLDIDHNHAIGPTEIDRYEQEIVPEIGAGGDGPGDGPPGGMGGRPPGGGGRHGGGMGGGPPGGGMGGGMGGGGPPDGGMGGGGPPGGGGGPPGGGGGGSGKSSYMYHASGAGRFGYIATPEPVTAADIDLNRSVTDKEFVEAAGRRFALLDANGDGEIVAKELPKLAKPRFRPRGGKGGPGGDRGPPPEER
ncbi:EF-hand domain-containing protein [Sphingomonas sp.]|uniref:EF-hand domain-containing protein n=1 Tax=Sphingomonas sp. TaxID=28214 RepID=UPI0025F0727E|nr:EF-hand domain-containing protein [Sphingomonas sp.]